MSNTAKLIQRRRALDELYREGVEVRLGRDAAGKRTTRIADKGEGYIVDGDGNRVPLAAGEVDMWIQPPNPLQREMALRNGNAARAKALRAAKRDDDSVERSTIMGFLAEMSYETLVDYVLTANLDKRRQDAMREVLSEDEWDDVTSLQDSIRVMEERREAEPDWNFEEDPEWLAIEELQEKFSDQVAAREAELRDAEYDVLKMLPREKLEEQATDRRVENVCTQAFMYEYELQMNYFSVRDIDDHDELFFENSSALAKQHDEVHELIRQALEPFISDGGEAKNLLGAESGSESSEPPASPETSEASTQSEPNE